MKKRILILASLCVLFIAGGFIASFFATKPVSADRVAQEVQQNLTRVLNEAEQKASEQLARIHQGKLLSISGTQFLLLGDDKILEWTDNHFIPSFYTLSGNYNQRYLKLASGDYILTKHTVDSSRRLVAIIPLHIQYRISNDYLPPYWHPEVFEGNRVLIYSPESEHGSPVVIKDQILFRVLPLQETQSGLMTGLWAIGLFGFALLLLILILAEWIGNLTRHSAVFGFFVLAVAAVVIRAIMILSRFPFRFSDWHLFDPKDFASSQFNPSMGDMLLNAVGIFLLCFYLFRNYDRFTFLFNSNRWVIGVLSSMGIFFGMLFPSVVTQTIYNNSAITLSISESLQFDLLRIAAFLLVIISWISAFLFVHVMMKLLTAREDLRQISISVVTGCFIFIGINELTGQVYFVSALVAIIYVVIVLSFTVYNALPRFQYASFVYFFIGVVAFSVSCTASVVYFENLRKAEDQQRFAENFLVERDYFGEYLMREAADKISKDAFILNRLSNPLLGKEAIKHKIKQVSLSGYFNRYTVSITLYDQLGIPFSDENDTVNYQDLSKHYSTEQFKTDYRNVFYVSDKEDRTMKKYIVLVPMKRNNTTWGYVKIELTLKRVIPENVYPELLVDNRFQQGYRPQELSYAVISSSQIEYSAGNFNYESLIRNDLANADLYTQGIERGEYLHVGVEDVSGRVAIVSSEAQPFLYQLSDFSFLILLGIAAVLVFLLIEGLIHYSGTRNLFFSARIQLILNLAFFVPLVAVCIITLGLTAKSSREELRDDFLSKANQFGKTVALTMRDYSRNNEEEFENEFKNVTTLANLDANLYATTGKLLATSQPLIFENQLLAEYLDPNVYRRLKRGEGSFVATDHAGTLEFYVAYSKILSPDTGEMLGILGIPFFQSGASIERMQITVLANIISIFTLIFIALLIVSFFVTKWLTAPLNMITKTLGRISLTDANKPLSWKSDDEIGLMVREYNRMLDTLSASKRELEKNQREKAWREIAQQVAHEIKNPLTPMKLTLQQLERSLQGENQHNEKLKKSVLSLLAQINSLDELASSFSSFAKMPEPVMKPVELIALLSKTINLHAQEGTINFRTNIQSAPVFADDQLLGRIFSNIILNGFQAVEKDKVAMIDVRLETIDPYFSVFISDNGSGIERELVDKIFLPHFTTKKAGSGLGLAIAKQGIEQMGGHISFKTASTGTIFRIDLPQNT